MLGALQPDSEFMVVDAGGSTCDTSVCKGFSAHVTTASQPAKSSLDL